MSKVMLCGGHVVYQEFRGISQAEVIFSSTLMCTERIFPLLILSSVVILKGIQKIVDAYQIAF